MVVKVSRRSNLLTINNSQDIPRNNQRSPSCLEKSPLDRRVSDLVSKFVIAHHGTNRVSAKNIRKNGLLVEGKSSGTTALLERKTGKTDSSAKDSCYVTTSPYEAAKYAKSFGKNGRIVSMVCLIKALTRDSQSGTDTAYKVQRVSRKCILPKKMEDLTSEHIRNIVDEFKSQGESVKPGEMEKFIQSKWEPNLVRSSLNNCQMSALDEVKQLQDATARLVFSKFGDLHEGEEISLSPEDMDRLEQGFLD